MSIAPRAGEDLVGLIRTVVRAELDRLRICEVGVVTELHAHEDASDTNNYEVTVQLRDSELVLPRCQVATPRIGVAAIPNVDDLVLLQFIGGDIHRPVVVGRLYNDVDRPPVSARGEHVYESVDEPESGVRRLFVKLPDDNQLEVTDEALSLQIGEATVQIEHGGNVTITSAGDVAIEADGSFQVTASGDVSIEAGGKLALAAGSDLAAEAKANATLTAGASGKLDAAAEATVKGAAVKIAGMTNFAAG